MHLNHKRTVLVILIVFVACTMLFAHPVSETKKTKRVGIISAMDTEIELLLSEAEIERVDVIGGLNFNVGKLCGDDVVIVKAGIGKVYASAGAVAMFNNYDIDYVIFTGVAGGVGDDTHVLDMVVATDLVSHDYGTVSEDGFFWRDEYSEDTKGRIYCDPKLVDVAVLSAQQVLGESRVFTGTIVTGDQFIASSWYVKQLQEQFNALACEMEGASVAAICRMYNIPCVVIRTMSDKADGVARETYEFMMDVAADNSCHVVMKMLEYI